MRELFALADKLEEITHQMHTTIIAAEALEDEEQRDALSVSLARIKDAVREVAKDVRRAASGQFGERVSRLT